MDKSPNKKVYPFAVAEDSYGFLSPTTFFTKCIKQHLWTLEITWDEPVPEVIVSTWRRTLVMTSNLKQFNSSLRSQTYNYTEFAIPQIESMSPYLNAD